MKLGKLEAACEIRLQIGDDCGLEESCRETGTVKSSLCRKAKNKQEQTKSNMENNTMD